MQRSSNGGNSQKTIKDAKAFKAAQKQLNRWEHDHPQWEIWQVKEALGNGVYHIIKPNTEALMKFVKTAARTNSGPGSFVKGDNVIVGFDVSKRGKPYILGFCSKGTEQSGGLANNWTHFYQGLERCSLSKWVPVEITHIQSITSGFGSTFDVRVYGEKIYIRTEDVILVRVMGEHRNTFYEDGAFVGSHYAPEFNYGTIFDFILDPTDNGNMLLLWSGGISKVNGSTLKTSWKTPFGGLIPSGHCFQERSLFVNEKIVGCLSAKDHRLYMLHFNKDDGTFIKEILLSQTTTPAGGFKVGENFLRVSGPTKSAPTDNFLTYWWDAVEPITRSEALNPYGAFLQGSASATYSNLGMRRFGKDLSTIIYNEFHWGAPAEPNEVLSICSMDSITSSNDKIIPRPPAGHYFPSLCAYNLDGTKVWEVKGWEAVEDDGPYHTRILYNPRVARDGKLYCQSLRLVYKDIVEDHVQLDKIESAWNNIPGDPNRHPTLQPDAVYYADNGWQPFISVLTTEWIVEGFITKKSRRLVTARVMFEVYDVNLGEQIISFDAQPELTSKFPTRGEYQGVLPPRYGTTYGPFSQTDQAMLDAAKTLFGYTTATYWPAASTYFTELEDGNYYAYGLYSNGVITGPTAPDFRVTPVWDVLNQKPGVDLDILEGDAYYDTSNNQGYNRVRQIPPAPGTLPTIPSGYPGAGSTGTTWCALDDQNNNGSLEDHDLPPPSAFLYETVWNKLSFDMPNVTNWADPIMSSDMSLLIFPPSSIGLLPPYPIPGSTYLDFSKFDSAGAGSDEYTSWSGGTIRNRMLHSVKITHDDWKLDERLLWRAYNWSGELVWTHRLEASEFETIETHGCSRACCGNGIMRIHHRINDGKIRERLVDDTTGLLISDKELTVIEPDIPTPPGVAHPEEIFPVRGDNGGTPHETILTNNVSILTTSKLQGFDFDTFEDYVAGYPYVFGLYTK